jgi:high-affinity nickel-transport protein
MTPGSARFGLMVLGLILGMRHATDPDHVIAVTAILTRERRLFSAARIGLVWGAGHSATVLAAGMAIIFFKLRVPARLGLSLEFMVAVVLIMLGLRAARDTLAAVAAKLHLTSPDDMEMLVHSHSHAHESGGGSQTHRHPHTHLVSNSHDLAHDHLVSAAMAPAASGRSLTKSFAVGLVHGLAGSAAIALLVTAAIPSPLWGMVYMTIFCVGVVIGMMLITTAVGAPFVLAVHRLARLDRKLSLAAGWLSFGFGIWLAYQIGIGEQLFGANPIWFPR